MIIDANCSNCKRAYRLPDTQVGKRVKCKGCGDAFVVVVEEEVPTLEEASDVDVRRSTRKQREEQEVEVLDDVEEFEEEEERVTASPKRRARRGDDEEDRPRRARRDRDEDEDEEDRSRRSRRDGDDDEDEEEEEPKKGGGGVIVILGVVAALLLLLCGGGGGLAYYASRKAADNAVAGINNIKPDEIEQWRNQIEQDKGKINPPNQDGGKINNPPPNQDGGKVNTPPINQGPLTINAALAMLKENDVQKKRLALQFLNTVAIESSRARDVEKAVEPLESDVQFLDDASKVLDRWAPSGKVERLTKLLDNTNSTVYRSAMDRLSRIKEDRAAEVLAGQLTVGGRENDAARYLPNMGTLCEKYVLPHYNDVGPAQTPARRVLTAIGTSNDARVKQCVADFEATSTSSDEKVEEATRQLKRTAIMNSLQKLKPTREMDLNEQVSKALEGLLTDKNPLLVDGAFKAMETWMVKDSVPAVIQLARKDAFKRGQALKFVEKFPDHEAVPPFLVELFLDNSQRDNAAKTLIAMGGKGEKAILDAKTWVGQQRDTTARRLAYLVLHQVGTRASIQPLRDFATIESRGGDKTNVQIALAAIKAIQAREKLPFDKNPPKDKIMPKDKTKAKGKIK